MGCGLQTYKHAGMQEIMSYRPGRYLHNANIHKDAMGHAGGLKWAHVYNSNIFIHNTYSVLYKNIPHRRS